MSNQADPGPGSGTTPRVTVRNLVKQFTRRGSGTSIRPIDNVSLELDGNELLVLLGPSGSGKTTLLRCIAGLERPDSGEILIDGEPVYSSRRRIFVPPDRRKLSMVFQSYALWPHMTVAQNVAFPLGSRGIRRSERDARVREILSLMGLEAIIDSYPGRISGGQQQRVALARALVVNPRLVLFDEPLSNVDAFVRQRLRVELVRMQRELGFSGIYVTHDQDEAMEVGQQIAVLDSGKVLALDKPENIYTRPQSLAVAQFVGTTNVWEATVKSVNGEYSVVEVDGFGDVIVAHGLTTPNGDGHPASGTRVTLVWRPEKAVLHAPAEAPVRRSNVWPGVVEQRLFSGPYTNYVVRCGQQKLNCWAVHSSWQEGDQVVLSVDPDDLRALVR